MSIYCNPFLKGTERVANPKRLLFSALNNKILSNMEAIKKMTLEEIIASKPSKLTVREASSIMGVTPRFLQMGLQQDKFPFGTAVKMDRWAYYINTERFIKYMLAKEDSQDV